MPNSSNSNENRPTLTKPKPETTGVSQENTAINILTVSADLSENEELSTRIEKINQEIQQYLETDKGQPLVLYEAAHHLIRGGGKHIRSLLTLLCCEAVNGDINKALKAALAAELLQTASLIHDDIIDDDQYRRGVQAVHLRFGQDIALLAGDLLIAQAVRAIGEIGIPELVVHMAIGGIRMCEGEAADINMNAEDQITFTENQYFRMVESKTVTFMKQAAIIGALVGCATASQIQALTSYAEGLGYVFQLRDDILDINTAPEVTQKTTHSDLRLKRGNLPLIHALEVAQDAERKHCLQALEAGDFTPVLELINNTKSIDYTFNIAKKFNEKAISMLGGQGFVKEELLVQLANYALLRKH
ncbi:MAG: polyprenyl synthetase family protein [Promethearchaeota archaeon]